MFVTSGTHERKMKAMRDENEGLMKRIEDLAAQVRYANEMVASRNKSIRRLESYIDDQSVANRELYEANRKLDHKLPARDAKGRFCSKRVKLELVA